MNFKEWVLCEEIFPNKTATVFHRTRDPSSIEKMLHHGFEAGAGMYGKGLYSTFALESQFQPYMERYGRYIVKFKVENLADFLITPLSVAKHILGSEYKISDQFKRHAKRMFGSSVSIGGSPRAIPMRIAEALPKYDRMQSESKYSSDLALELSNNMPSIKKLSGMVYWGRQDGYCLVKHDPVDEGLVMLGYSEADVDDQSKYEKLSSNRGWKTTAVGGSIKHLYGTGQKGIKAGDEVYLLSSPGWGRDFMNKTLKVLSVNGGNAEVETNGWEWDDSGRLLKIREVFPLSHLILKRSSDVPQRYKLSDGDRVAS